MTELSPAAQAVLDAVVNCSHPHLAGMGANKDKYAQIMAPTAAAALRAAADQFPWDQGYSAMHCSLHLQAIAEELEN